MDPYANNPNNYPPPGGSPQQPQQPLYTPPSSPYAQPTSGQYRENPPPYTAPGPMYAENQPQYSPPTGPSPWPTGGNTGFPSTGYPGMGGYPPTPPNQNRMPGWAWGIIGGFLVIILVLGGLLYTNHPNTTTPLAQATATPLPTDTAIPTNTAIPQNSGTIVLGSDYQSDGNGGFQIVGETTSFSSGDSFAYVVTLDQGIGTTQAQILWVLNNSDGTQSVEQSRNIAISDPSHNLIAQRFSDIASLISTPGDYTFEISDGHSVVASVDFTYDG